MLRNLNRLFAVLILVAIVIVNGYAQKNIENIIVGQWKTVDPNGDTVKFSFDANLTMSIASRKLTLGKGEFTTKDGQKAKSLMKYELNTKEKPFQLSFIFFIDNFYNPVNKSDGIIEVLNDNLLRMAMTFNKNEKRPDNYTNKVQTRILFRVNSKNEVTDCQKFKDGKFKIIDPVMGETIIDRRSDFQEQTDAKGPNYRFKVNWTGPCGYELYQMQTFTNNVWVSDTTGLVTTVDIVHTTKKSYLYIITYNKSKFKLFGELTKIK